MSKAVNDGTAVVAFFGRPSHRRFEWAHHRANKRIECIEFWHDLFSSSMYYIDRLVHKGNEWCILYESYGVSCWGQEWMKLAIYWNGNKDSVLIPKSPFYSQTEQILFLHSNFHTKISTSWLFAHSLASINITYTDWLISLCPWVT